MTEPTYWRVVLNLGITNMDETRFTYTDKTKAVVVAENEVEAINAAISIALRDCDEFSAREIALGEVGHYISSILITTVEKTGRP